MGGVDPINLVKPKRLTQSIIQAYENVKEELSAKTGGISFADDTVNRYYLPLIEQYVKARHGSGSPFIIGIQGCQGVGKSVLTTFLVPVLRSAGYRVVGFSIDDLYLSYDDRKKFAQSHLGNPFYYTRGMPGTHRYEKLMDMLSKARQGVPFDIPVFDKSLHQGKGDITGESISVEEPLDFLLLEGWCVNMPWCPPEEFPKIMLRNHYAYEMFKAIDPEQQYYQSVLAYVKTYKSIWQYFDHNTALIGKDIRWVGQWREEQEDRLKAHKGEGMSSAAIQDFIRPYIPFTWLYYDRLKSHPEEVESLMEIGEDHLPVNLHFPEPVPL